MEHVAKHGKPGRFMAALLSLSMIFSMFGGVSGLNSVSVASAEEQDNSKDGPTQGVRLRQADPSTMDDYQTVLNLASPPDGSRYAGRLWSDKSVFAIGYDDKGDRKDQWKDGKLTLTEEKDGVEESGVNNVIDATDADFLHVYSVLGSSERIEENIPVDLIISIDITNSMINGDNDGEADSEDRGAWSNAFGEKGEHNDSNLSKVLTAANTLMQKVHEHSNKSRISVVVYWGTAYQMIPFVDGSVEFTGYSVRHDNKGDNAEGIPEPVIHYTIIDATEDSYNGDYVYDPVFGDHYQYKSSKPPENDTYNPSNYHTGRLTLGVGGETVKQQNGQDTGKDTAADLGAGTCTEAGVYTALKALADRGRDGHRYQSVTGEMKERIPVAVILGDGDTNHTLVKKGDSDAGNEASGTAESVNTISSKWWDVYTDENGHMKSAASKAADGKKANEKAAVIGGVLQGAFWRAAVAKAYGYDNVDDVHVYTIGIAKSDESYPVLDPKSWFTDVEKLKDYGDKIDNWKNGADTAFAVTDGSDGGYKGNPSSLGRNGATYTYNAPTKENLGEYYDDYGVELNQLDYNYTKKYYSTSDSTSIDNIFEDIFSEITQNVDVPINGSNDLSGVVDNDSNSVTFKDSIGKYMEVKDVKNVVLFGETYEVTKEPGSDGALMTYKIKDDEDDIHLNPAYKEMYDWDDIEPESSKKSKDDIKKDMVTNSAAYKDHAGVYKLSDITIEVRESNDILTGPQQTFWVDVPVNALPLRTASISVTQEGTTYTTNQNETFPLRVFYTVGVTDKIKKDDGTIDVSKIVVPGESNDYIDYYKVTEETKKDRNLEVGDIEFFSNYYSKRDYSYPGYEGESFLYGDAEASFSPSNENRYYVFQEAMPLYSIEKTDSSRITDDVKQNGITIIDFSENDILSDDEIKASLFLKGFGGSNLIRSSDEMEDSNWYFIIVQYFVPDGGSGKIKYTAIPRKGSEFGVGNADGNYLCWYDANEENYGVTETQEYGDTTPEKTDKNETWVIAVEEGGLRSGVLARNAKKKSLAAEPTAAGYSNGNITRTADYSYLPTIGTTPHGGPVPAVNVFLGNNGRLVIRNAKTEISPGEGENVGVGSKIEYKIHWEGNATEKSFVKVVDPLDKGVDFVSAKFDGISEVNITADSPSLTAQGKATIDATPNIPVKISYDSASHTVTWEIGTKDENDEKVPASAGGDVLLTVKVNKDAFKGWEYKDGDNSGADGTDEDYNVKNRAQIEVNDNSYFTNTVENPTNEKTEVTPGDGEPAGVGDPIEYSIHWENDRGQDSIVTVTDPLDIGVDFVSASYRGIEITADSPNNTGEVEFSPGEMTPVAISYDSAARTVTWKIGNDDHKVPATVNDNVYLNVKVNEKAIQKWTYELEENKGTPGEGEDFEVLNRAHIQVGDHGSYTNTVENPTPHNGKEEVDPHEGDLVGIGQEITYEISWHNHEAVPANIDIIDVLDPGVDFVSASDLGEYKESMGAIYDGRSYNFQHLVVWHLGEQPAGASGKVTLTVKVNAKAVERYTYDGDASELVPGEGKDYEVFNQAKVKVGNNPFADTDIVENPVPDKDETKVEHAGNSESNPPLTPKEGEEDDTVTGPQVFVGDEITYKIHWLNKEKNSAGESVGAEVVITDKLDPGVDFVSADNDGVYDSETHTVTWKFQAKPDTEGDVELVVRVNDKALPVGTVQNQAQVQVGDDPAVDTKIIENPTPKVEKTEVSPGEGMQVMPGDEIEYEISWHNYDASREFADVTITDKLDPGVDFVSASFGDINISSSDSSDSGKLPTEADLTVILDGEEDIQDEFPFTLKLTAPKTPEEPGAPEGRPLEGSYHWKRTGREGETNGTVTWEADDKESKFSFELKTGESLTVEDLPVGTVYTLEHTLEQGSQTITKGSKLGVFGSSVLVHVEPQTKPVSSGGQAGTSREPGVSTSGNANKKVIPDQKAEEPAVKRNVAPRWNTGLRFRIPALSTPSDASENRLPQAQAGYPAATVPNAAGQGHLPEQEQPEYPVATPSDPTELTDLYEFSLISIEDLPAPAAAPEEEENGGEGEEADMTYTGRDEYGDVTIEYFAQSSHKVVWTLKHRPAKSSGFVRLTVRVNEDAEKFWSYDEPDAGPSDTVKDERVRNQAGVRVGNNPEVKTQIVENPTEPEKRETEIEDKDVSRDLEVDWDEDEEGGLDDFIGPEVHVGDTITYTVTWQNNARDGDGNPIPSWVVVIDTLDPGVDFVSAGVEKIVPDPDQPELMKVGNYHKDGYVLSPPEGYDSIEIPARSVVWDFGEQPPRATGRVTLKVRVNENALPAAGTTEGEVVNSAEVTVGNIPTVTNQVTNPVGGPRKTEIRPGDGEPVQIGDQIDYEITWRNYKSESATVVIMDTLDPGVDFVSATDGGKYYAETKTLNDGTRVPAHTVVWELSEQAAGATGKVSLSVRVNSRATQDYTYKDTADDFTVGEGRDNCVYNRARVKVGNDDFQYTETPENPVEPPDNPPSNPPDNPPRVPTEPYTPTEPEVPPTEPEVPTVENRETPPQQLTKLPDAEPEQSVPYTGDDRHPGFWLAVMGISMAAAWFSLWQIRKIVRSEKVPGRSRKRHRRW